MRIPAASECRHRKSRLGRSSFALIGCGMLLVSILVGIAWYGGFLTPTPTSIATVDPGTGAEANSLKNLRLAIEAVSAAEDAQYGRAMQLWAELLEIYPNDADLQLNQAVTVLKWLAEANNQLDSGKVTEAEAVSKLRTELNEAYTLADAVVSQLASLESADYRASLLQAALLEEKARRFEYPNDQQLRRQAADILAGALAGTSAQPIMACKFDDLVQELAAGDRELSKQNADFLFKAWKSQPRNLYLLSRAAETLLRNQDPRVGELLEPSLELTKPMLGMVASSLKRFDPAEKIPQIKSAVAEGDWRTAQQLIRWLNLFKGMSGFQPDVRLVKPDIMALLDTSFLARMKVGVETVSTESPALPKFRTETIGERANEVAWYDYNLDLSVDLVTLDGRVLSLFANDPNAGLLRQPAQQQQLSFEARGLTVADLFEVDSPSRPRVPESVAELMGALQATIPVAEKDDASLAGQANQQPSGNRHDTVQELIVWGDEGISIFGVNFSGDDGGPLNLLESDAGLAEIKGVTCLLPIDIESDGDLDLVVATRTGIQVLQNSGNRTFTDISEFSDLRGPVDGLSQLVACDYDADLDQDVLAIGPATSTILLLENILHGQFRARELTGGQWPTLSNPTDLAVADLDGNASWDWMVTDANGLHVTTTRTPQIGTVVPGQSTRFEIASQALVVADINNDSFLDMVLGSDLGMSVLIGSRQDSGKAPAAQTLNGALPSVGKLAAADCNQDGILDFALISDGKAQVMYGETVGDNGFLSARVRGINDVNGGGRINHYAIGSILELWSGGTQQRRIVQSPSTHFGLGDGLPDNLRIVFTNGLTQNLESPQENTLVEEVQELKGSCPFVYGWNGDRFELITDLLWNAPLGLQTARGQTLPDRRWEYLLLPGGLMQMRDGAYELRVTEELWELAYFDHIHLIAVDHSETTDLLTNEKVGPPSLAPHKLFKFHKKLRPIAAIDHQGRDIRNQLALRDRVFAQAFRQRICQGLVEPHCVELDFGNLPLEKPLKLVLNGWMHPTDTSLNIAISQNAERSLPEPPSLWVVGEDGVWVCAQSFMGFPGGKPKSIVVDLKDVFQSDDHRLRIATSQELYWDEAFVAWEGDEETVQEYPLKLESAQLRYRGFSELLPRPADQPHWYDYQRVSIDAKWPELEGPFTRFGDVREMVDADDNQMVVMTSGDEIVLRFKPPEAAVPLGFRRDFVLHCTGWDKDADLNTLAGQGSSPLPFAEQTAYPAPPEQADEADAVWQLNRESLTRFRQLRPTEAWRQ